MNKVIKSEEEWRAQLTPEQFAITRQRETEPAFSGEYCDTKENGIYRCICCDAPLFHATSKYDSGSGWPSFFQPVSATVIMEKDDTSLGAHRTEINCAACGAHLGHVFPDGPVEKTGLRYCTNSASLCLKKA